MAEPLLRVLAMLRGHLLDPAVLVRAVASGRQRGTVPQWRRIELRYVDLKAGPHLQVTCYDDRQATVANHPAGSDQARDAVDDLLELPFGNWHVDTTTQSHQMRVTKRLEALLHTRDHAAPISADRDHDRDKGRLLDEDDPVLIALGLSSAEGRIKPSRQSKFRQVEEFLRLLDASLNDAISKGHLRRPSPESPLRIVDLGCGNAYLTLAAQRFLSHVRGLPVTLIGVDVREEFAARNAAVSAALGDGAEFVAGTIAGVALPAPPDVVLALHACDTATDDALARAVSWRTPLILAAPCCHHDLASQLRAAPTPAPYSVLTRHGILRERFADTLTDGVRASLLRLQGYRVDVMAFVESQHTPRNTMIRAVLTGAPISGGSVLKEYDELVATWSIRPRLAELLETASGA